MRLAAVSALALLVPILPPPAIPAVPAVAEQAWQAAGVVSDTREPARRIYAVPESREARIARKPAPTPPVGTVRQWLGLDERTGSYYRKDFTLRAVGEHIEVWVAVDLAFPAGDCRTDAVEVTADQIKDLVQEFDTVIYPVETTAFSTPPDRDGTGARFEGDFTGDGTRTVTLVDNVKDENFHDFPKTPTYIAGFFSAQLNDLFDRNVMTIDAYDWKHRSGARPPHEPTDDLCTSRPARPRMYEGTFAHEWQHLLLHYADPVESLWVNEGLSDYAQTLVGYVDPAKLISQRGADPHLTCFQGFGVIKTAYNTTPRDCGGPENSLNLWNEGATSEVLADYGHAYQFMLYLADRFGPSVLSAIHRDRGRQGLDGVRAALPGDLYGTLHDFQTMTLVDRVVGDGDVRFSAASLRSAVNLANPAAYDTPGAAPNGADYVPLPVSGDALRSVTFVGAKTLPPLPLAWTVVDGALFSGDASSIDRSAVVGTTVPAKDPELRFRAKYGAEAGYDFGYVTVSTDGGRTYTPIKGDRTVPAPLGPAVTGRTDGFVPHVYNLSAFAGKKILLGFRYVTDAGVNQGGWYVDGITVGDRKIASSRKVFRSPTQIVPAAVHNWDVRLVGLPPAGGKAAVGKATGGKVTGMKQVPVARFAELAGYPTVVAIVAYDEPTEEVTQYAPYRLTVNGRTMPGGR